MDQAEENNAAYATKPSQRMISKGKRKGKFKRKRNTRRIKGVKYKKRKFHQKYIERSHSLLKKIRFKNRAIIATSYNDQDNSITAEIYNKNKRVEEEEEDGEGEEETEAQGIIMVDENEKVDEQDISDLVAERDRLGTSFISIQKGNVKVPQIIRDNIRSQKRRVIKSTNLSQNVDRVTYPVIQDISTYVFYRQGNKIIFHPIDENTYIKIGYIKIEGIIEVNILNGSLFGFYLVCFKKNFDNPTFELTVENLTSNRVLFYKMFSIPTSQLTQQTNNQTSIIITPDQNKSDVISISTHCDIPYSDSLQPAIGFIPVGATDNLRMNLQIRGNVTYLEKQSTLK